jgi:hypothetical protein
MSDDIRNLGSYSPNFRIIWHRCQSASKGMAFSVISGLNIIECLLITCTVQVVCHYTGNWLKHADLL